MGSRRLNLKHGGHRREAWQAMCQELENPPTEAEGFRDFLVKLSDAAGCLKSKTQYSDVVPMLGDIRAAQEGLVERFFEFTLPKVCQLCIAIPSLFPDSSVQLLRKNAQKTVTLTEKQCLALLCGGFLSILPETSEKISAANFRKFYRGAGQVASQREKLIGILSALEVLFRDGGENLANLETKVRVTRGAQPETQVAEFWENSDEKLMPLEIVAADAEKDVRRSA